MTNKHENEFKELQSLLENAMEEIKTLKSQVAGKEARLYRFFIPEYDANNNKVPEEKRMDDLQVLQEASCRDNGRYTMYQGESGYYPEELMSQPFDPQKIVKEKVIIFDTYVNNPHHSRSPQTLSKTSVSQQLGPNVKQQL